MEKVDRRTLFGVAGASLALAACKKVEGGPTTQSELGFYDNEARLSEYKQFGKQPEQEVSNIPESGGKRKPKGFTGSFSPKYCCLVYMKFVDGTFTAKHAYFEIASVNIAEQFTAISSGRDWISPVYGRSEVNFENFGFGSQNKIYFYVDNGDDVLFRGANSIQFNPVDERGSKKALNNAFLNAEEDTTTWPGKTLLTLENWYVNENGKPIPNVTAHPNNVPVSAQRLYSINILLNMKLLGTSKYFPVIVDPGGGNGTSKP